MEEILKYFPNITDLQKKQFAALGELYPQWNDKINVISRKDISNIYIHHILHSLSIAKFLDPVSGTRILDLGTGGGFPGIPLAIMWPHCNFHMIDRIGKKILVAQNIAGEIKLKNVTFQHGDIKECHEKFDFTVSRAVMPLEGLIKCVRRNIAKKNNNSIENGVICLKGGDLNEELRDIKESVTIIDLSTFFSEEFFLTKKIIYVKL